MSTSFEDTLKQDENVARENEFSENNEAVNQPDNKLVTGPLENQDKDSVNTTDVVDSDKKDVHDVDMSFDDTKHDIISDCTKHSDGRKQAKRSKDKKTAKLKSNRKGLKIVKKAVGNQDLVNEDNTTEQNDTVNASGGRFEGWPGKVGVVMAALFMIILPRWAERDSNNKIIDFVTAEATKRELHLEILANKHNQLMHFKDDEITVHMNENIGGKECMKWIEEKREELEMDDYSINALLSTLKKRRGNELLVNSTLEQGDEDTSFRIRIFIALVRSPGMFSVYFAYRNILFQEADLPGGGLTISQDPITKETKNGTEVFFDITELKVQKSFYSRLLSHLRVKHGYGDAYENSGDFWRKDSSSGVPTNLL